MFTAIFVWTAEFVRNDMEKLTFLGQQVSARLKIAKNRIVEVELKLHIKVCGMTTLGVQ